jgi:hypothetical protein
MLAASMITTIILMMEAVSTSELSVTFYQITLSNIPEDNHLHYVTSLPSIFPPCLQSALVVISRDGKLLKPAC